MLITARTAFALRCPQCGKMESTTVSRFSLSGGRSAHVTCSSCGAQKLTVGVRPGQVWLQIPCYLCDGVHFHTFTPKQFWNSEVKPIICSETELQLGVFGAEEAAEAHARSVGSDLDRLLEDAAFSDYFDQPDIMYRVLELVHAMADDGNLRCVCGSRQISVDIYPERLELTCTECGQRKALPAESETDLTAVEQVAQITVGDDFPGCRSSGKHHKK